jgi:5-methylcytosine-specific restriction protein A
MSTCPRLKPCALHPKTENRSSATERGYGPAWEKARAAYLLKHPACVSCGGPANTVDHITPHRGDKALFWDSGNWQSMCARCHSRKTATHDGGFGHKAA